jgi:hypothetical protein
MNSGPIDVDTDAMSNVRECSLFGPVNDLMRPSD